MPVFYFWIAALAAEGSRLSIPPNEIPPGLKPVFYHAGYGTAEAVPFQSLTDSRA